MAVLDIRKCSFRLVDGRKATLTIGSTNAAITYTMKSTHHGTKQDVKVAHVCGAALSTLSVAVTNSDDLYTITVTLASTDGATPTSTAAQVKTAVDASLAAAALVTTSLPGTGASAAVVAVAAVINTTPARSVEYKVGDGTLTWSESQQFEYTENKGDLDGVKENDEVPVTLDTSFTWEEFRAVMSSGSPTAVDALLQIGEASGWTSTSDDTTGCSPYCVDLEIEINPNCGNQKKEYIVFEEFNWDDIAPNYKDGKVAFKGSANRVRPKYYRI